MPTVGTTTPSLADNLLVFYTHGHGEMTFHEQQGRPPGENGACGKKICVPDGHETLMSQRAFPVRIADCLQSTAKKIFHVLFQSKSLETEEGRVSETQRVFFLSNFEVDCVAPT